MGSVNTSVLSVLDSAVSEKAIMTHDTVLESHLVRRWSLFTHGYPCLSMTIGRKFQKLTCLPRTVVHRAIRNIHWKISNFAAELEK